MEKIRASVVMATYNGGRYIEKQIKSILNNLSEEDELIISDDGSSDETVSIIKKYLVKNVSLIQGPRKGVMKNFESALRLAKGEYIFLTDQDDIWTDQKMEKMLASFKNPKVTAVVHDVALIDEKDQIFMPSFYKYRKSKSGVIHNIVKNSYLGCAMGFRGSMKKAILPIPVSPLMNDQWHDQWIGLLCDYYGEVVFDENILGYYRRHGENKSSMQRGSIHQMILNRIVIVKSLISRVLRQMGG